MQADGSGASGASGGLRTSHTSRTSQTSQTSGGPVRQSGAPASGAQSTHDLNRLGLPDLSGNSNRLTPRVAQPDQPQQPQQPSRPAQSGAPAAQPAQPAQPGQPHTLGITSKLARVRATGSPSLPPPGGGGTLTQQIRAVAPPDVAKQTVDEQKTLANELLTLPDALETSGLAKTHESSYLAAVRSYVALADETWIAIAEERLEQSGGEPVYRQRAISIARQVIRMRNESQLAAKNTQFPLPRKRPLFWRRRVGMIRSGMLDWQAHLAMPADPHMMGRSLVRLRGAAALAEASDIEMLLWSLFSAAVGGMVMLLWLGFVVSLIGVLAQGALATVGALVLAAVATLAVRVALSLLLRRGPARLDRLFALSVYSTPRTPRADADGSSIIAGLLRFWGFFATAAGLLGMLAGFGYSVWQIIEQQFAMPPHPIDWIAQVGSIIARVSLIPALVGLATVGALALPLLLVSAIRYMAELGGNIGWVPGARRYALAPAFQVVAFLAASTIAGLVAVAPITGLREIILTPVAVGEVAQNISLQTVALYVVPALVLLVGLDIPYRVGIVRWRRYWLRELTTRRADIDAHVRRLSAVDPQTGMQDTSEENLRAMQYDMVLLQFYNTRTEETRRVSSAPYGWLAGIGVVLLLAVVALLVDGLAQQLARLLLHVG